MQGKRGDRFVYISWGLTPDPDDFGLFRRAKVILDEMPVDLLEAQAVMATIKGTAADGGTVCARGRPENGVGSRA